MNQPINLFSNCHGNTHWLNPAVFISNQPFKTDCADNATVSHFPQKE